MKKSMLTLMLFFFVLIASGQEKNKFRVIIIKPKADMVMEFEKGLAAHIQKYHPKATDPVTIYRVASGSRSGEYHYVQGPNSWTELSEKQYAGDHSDDWTRNVSKYVVSEEAHYYAHQEQYSYSGSEGSADWAVLSFYTLNAGTNSTFTQILKTRKEALEKAKDTRSYTVSSHVFAGRDNEHQYVMFLPLRGGFKDLDTPLANMNKILNEHIGHGASVEDSKAVEASYKKLEVMLIRKIDKLSSK